VFLRAKALAQVVARVRSRISFLKTAQGHQSMVWIGRAINLLEVLFLMWLSSQLLSDNYHVGSVLRRCCWVFGGA